MSTQDQPLLPNSLPAINRFITDHDSSGQAVFNTSIPDALEWKPVGSTATFGLAYTTSTQPVRYYDKSTNDTTADITAYSRYLENAPGITIPGGTVLRIVDIGPGITSPMHRTVSLDYGVVLEGEIELILDSGEKRLMRKGDVSIQRGTNHAWKNVAPNGQWSRMLYVLQVSEVVEVKKEDGSVAKLGEDYGIGMDGVRPSGQAEINGH